MTIINNKIQTQTQITNSKYFFIRISNIEQGIMNVEVNTQTISVGSLIGQKIRDYGLLFKFRLSLTVVFSAAMGYLLAIGGSIDWAGLGLLCLGGFLLTGASNALNQVLEKDYDKLMSLSLIHI